MKRFLLYLLALAPLSAFAQLNGSGFYRVQNENTKRYITIVDDRAYRVGTTGVDLKAIYLQNEADFAEKVACNPASVCYIDVVNGSQLDLIGQGLQLSNYNYLLNYLQRGDGYRLWGTAAGIDVFLLDTSRGTSPGTSQGDGAGNRNWLFLPVDQSDDQYFGVKPDVTASADGSYWATMYAGFPFAPTADTKVYTVNSVKNGYAIIKEITADVPAQTPVLFRCGSANASGNKLMLKPVSTSGSFGTNYLVGNYYCNDVTDTDSERKHRNVTNYNSATMRMLGTASDGKPAFVKSNISYIPANKCYLAVSSSAPAELKIVTEAEYEEITGIEELTSGQTEGAEVIYDLQGRRVAALSKGLYIVNGKKVIVR